MSSLFIEWCEIGKVYSKMPEKCIKIVKLDYFYKKVYYIMSVNFYE